MARKKNTNYFVYGYTRKLFCGDNGQPLFNAGVQICSTWNMAKAIHEYAKQVQSAEYDHLILFRENEIFAQIDKPVA